MSEQAIELKEFLTQQLADQKELRVQISELIVQMTIMNERLPSHIKWAEERFQDHEDRLRVIRSDLPRDIREQFAKLHSEIKSLQQSKWIMLGAAAASGGVGAMLSTVMGAK